MILYLDTSSLVKLYVHEAHSLFVKQWVDDSEIIATCRIAYPEAISAMSRRFRQGNLSQNQYKLIVSKFSKDWGSFAVIDFDEVDAGHLVSLYGLRGFDAVHLSAAKLLRGNDISISFSSFDEKLNSAAAAEGFVILEA